MTKTPPASWSDLEPAAPPTVETSGGSDSSEGDAWTPSGPLALSRRRPRGALADLPGTRALPTPHPQSVSQAVLQPRDTVRAGWVLLPISLMRKLRLWTCRDLPEVTELGSGRTRVRAEAASPVGTDRGLWFLLWGHSLSAWGSADRLSWARGPRGSARVAAVRVGVPLSSTGTAEAQQRRRQGGLWLGLRWEPLP